MEVTMTFGTIDEVNVGSRFDSRRALYDAGVHRTLQAGIVGRQNIGAESVVLSGGYDDDEDFGDVIVYTGDGGQDDNNKQVADQTFDGKNKALCRNHLEAIPIRVIRGANHRSPHSPDAGYQYDGLFQVESFWRERRPHGFLVCRYRLVRLDSEEIGLPQFEDAPPAGTGPARRSKSTQYRIVRDRDLAGRVKEWHECRCQVCGIRIEVEGGFYAEAAHIRPLGRPHDGPDVAENIICLCPNHHVAFDNGALFVADDLSLVGAEGKLISVKRHRPATEHFQYHRSIWGRA
jgi:putative restriction endonuclease